MEADSTGGTVSSCGIVVFIGTLAFAMAFMIGYIVLPGLTEDSLFRNNGIWLGISGIGLVALWGMVIHGNRKNAMKEK